MTYNEAYNKIIDAYFKDEIKPFDREFCFCGTLSLDKKNWRNSYRTKKYDYTAMEYIKMEAALFSQMRNVIYCRVVGSVRNASDPELEATYTEDELFYGMCAALDVLKQIHIERGEVIEEGISFTQRKTNQPCTTTEK